MAQQDITGPAFLKGVGTSLEGFVLHVHVSLTRTFIQGHDHCGHTVPIVLKS